jgi:hypothetical protein
VSPVSVKKNSPKFRARPEDAVLRPLERRAVLRLRERVRVERRRAVTPAIFRLGVETFVTPPASAQLGATASALAIRATPIGACRMWPPSLER